MNRIKEVLEQKGIKQTWLAEKLGKSYNMVNAYAQNRQQPRLETLMEIAEILDLAQNKQHLNDAIKRGNVYIDGWTASINTTLQQYKEDVKIVF